VSRRGGGIYLRYRRGWDNAKLVEVVGGGGPVGMDGEG